MAQTQRIRRAKIQRSATEAARQQHQADPTHILDAEAPAYTLSGTLGGSTFRARSADDVPWGQVLMIDGQRCQVHEAYVDERGEVTFTLKPWP